MKVGDHVIVEKFIVESQGFRFTIPSCFKLGQILRISKVYRKRGELHIELEDLNSNYVEDHAYYTIGFIAKRFRVLDFSNELDYLLYVKYLLSQ